MAQEGRALRLAQSRTGSPKSGRCGGRQCEAVVGAAETALEYALSREELLMKLGRRAAISPDTAWRLSR